MNHNPLVKSLTICYFPLHVTFVRPIQEYVLSLIDSFFTDVCVTVGGHTRVYPSIPLLITFHFSDTLKLTVLPRSLWYSSPEFVVYMSRDHIYVQNCWDIYVCISTLSQIYQIMTSCSPAWLKLLIFIFPHQQEEILLLPVPTITFVIVGLFRVFPVCGLRNGISL